MLSTALNSLSDAYDALSKIRALSGTLVTEDRKDGIH